MCQWVHYCDLVSFFLPNVQPCSNFKSACVCVCTCIEWLQSSIFSGGLQTSQIHYSYNEEKDEDHCSSLGTTTPDKAKLYSRRITLSDHAQPFLQAIADNNTQDHTVKVLNLRPDSNFEQSLSGWRMRWCFCFFVPMWQDFLCQIERCCKQYHLITPITFPPEHPVEEVGRLLLCCLLKHQDLGKLAIYCRGCSLRVNEVPLPGNSSLLSASEKQIWMCFT